MLHTLINSNDISYMEEPFIKLHVDTLGRFYVSKYKIYSGRHETPQDAKLAWHRTYRKLRKSGKYSHALYTVSHTEPPPHVDLAALHYMVDFRFKSGFDNVRLVNDDEFKGAVISNGNCVLTKLRKHPAECAWDLHTMTRVSVVEDTHAILNGNVVDEDIMYMLKDGEYRGINCFKDLYYGNYSINGVKKSTPGCATAREAAWLLHQLRISNCIDTPATGAIKRTKDTSATVRRLRAETSAAITDYRDSLREQW